MKTLLEEAFEKIDPDKVHVTKFGVERGHEAGIVIAFSDGSRLAVYADGLHCDEYGLVADWVPQSEVDFDFVIWYPVKGGDHEKSNLSA